MPTPTKGARLGGGPAHERQILANLAQSLFEHGRITTTVTKAKRLRPYAERLVTIAKRGDLASRRRVMGTIPDKGVVHKLFTEIGARLRRARRRLHPHHEGRLPQGRQRSPRGDRARRVRHARQEGRRQGGLQGRLEGRRSQGSKAAKAEAGRGSRRRRGRDRRGHRRDHRRGVQARCARRAPPRVAEDVTEEVAETVESAAAPAEGADDEDEK